MKNINRFEETGSEARQAENVEVAGLHARK